MNVASPASNEVMKSIYKGSPTIDNCKPQDDSNNRSALDHTDCKENEENLKEFNEFLKIEVTGSEALLNKMGSVVVRQELLLGKLSRTLKRPAATGNVTVTSSDGHVHKPSISIQEIDKKSHASY